MFVVIYLNYFTENTKSSLNNNVLKNLFIKEKFKTLIIIMIKRFVLIVKMSQKWPLLIYFIYFINRISVHILNQVHLKLYQLQSIIYHYLCHQVLVVQMFGPRITLKSLKINFSSQWNGSMIKQEKRQNLWNNYEMLVLYIIFDSRF